MKRPISSPHEKRSAAAQQFDLRSCTHKQDDYEAPKIAQAKLFKYRETDHITDSTMHKLSGMQRFATTDDLHKRTIQRPTTDDDLGMTYRTDFHTSSPYPTYTVEPRVYREVEQTPLGLARGVIWEQHNADSYARNNARKEEEMHQVTIADDMRQQGDYCRHTTCRRTLLRPTRG